jgi:hypothetical protein
MRLASGSSYAKTIAVSATEGLPSAHGDGGCGSEVRAGMRLENALRRRKSGFRTFVHPETRMRELITRAGFDLVSQRQTLEWSADVFVRRA